MKQIKNIGVVGAGVMGAQIAGWLAGCGFDVTLLDIVPPKGPTAADQQEGITARDVRFRNRLSMDAIARLAKLKPSPLYAASDVQRLRAGNLEDHLDWLRQCDWVIEAVVERLDIKHALYEKIVSVLASDAVLTSNTSGLLWAQLAEGMSADVRRRFFITHFFNPPRYMKLVEVIAGPDADPRIVNLICGTLEHFGKGVVRAKDTPNFIANRIGIYHFLDVMHLTEQCGWPIEAVDAVLGEPTAHPKSAVFRTADVVGLDTLGMVAETVIKACRDDVLMQRCRIPQYLQQMIVRGWTGQKAGRGFYLKNRDDGTLLVIDPSTLEYRPMAKFRTPSLGEARNITDPAARLRSVVLATDQAGEIAWPTISHMLVYAAARVPEISDDIVQIDRAMRWGFNWQIGPFEMWDALGVSEVAHRLEKESVELPSIVQQLLSADAKNFYRWKGTRREYFDIGSKAFSPDVWSVAAPQLAHYHEGKNVIAENGGTSLLDMGDGVLCCEFHTKMNALDADVIGMLDQAVDRVESDGIGMMIANQGAHFSAGANLLMILMSVQQGRWEELDATIRSFQGAMQRLRFCKKPVIAAPFGMTLGGGCEVALAAGKMIAAAETYIGLVELGAGVIPAGGGCKNLLLRFEEAARRAHDPKDHIWFSPDDGGPFPKAAKAFELIGTARVATSAFDARNLGFLSAEDVIAMDGESLIAAAKRVLLEWAPFYQMPQPQKIWLAGEGGKMALIDAAEGLRRRGLATEYDCIIAEKLAHVLCGGDQPHPHYVDEQHVLDLEREAFLSLCGEQKTQERMAHLLQTGKPLRN